MVFVENKLILTGYQYEWGRRKITKYEESKITEIRTKTVEERYGETKKEVSGDRVSSSYDRSSS